MTDLPAPAPAPPTPRHFRRPDGSVRPGWAVVLFVVLVLAAEWALAKLLPRPPPDLRMGDLVGVALTIRRVAAAAAATWLCCKVVRWRFGDAYLRDARWWARFLQGLALGTGALCLVVLVPLAFGYERFSASTAGAGALAAAFFWTALTCTAGSFSEELMVRGFALRQLERWAGRPGAAVMTSAGFGLMHSFNPEVSWYALANIALAGLWMAVMVQGTGSLWAATGLHCAWNLVQGFVWGQPVSGFPISTSLLVRGPPGDELWTGGSFGPEASAINTAVTSALVVATFAWYRRRPTRAEAPADNAPAPVV